MGLGFRSSTAAPPSHWLPTAGLRAHRHTFAGQQPAALFISYGRKLVPNAAQSI